MRMQPVPAGAIMLFQILGGSERVTARAARMTGRDPHFIRAAAAFYVEEVLWAVDGDPYRTLGVARDAPQGLVVEHLRAAMAWLLPYLGSDKPEAAFAPLVLRAGDTIGTPEARSAYDESRRTERAANERSRYRLPRIWPVAVVALFAIVVFSAIELTGRISLENPQSDSSFVAAPAAAAVTQASEANPAIEIVRVQVKAGAIPAPGPEEISAVPSVPPPRAEAPVAERVADVAPMKSVPPSAVDFETAFLPEGNAPTGSAELLSAQSAVDQPRPDVVDIDQSAEAPVALALVDQPGAENGEALAMAPTPEEAVAENPVVLLGETDRPADRLTAESTTSGVSPSFNCGRARTATERLICSDPALAAKDREMAKLYGLLLDPLSGSSRDAAADRQREWLRDRDSCKEPDREACVRRAYDTRRRELKEQPNWGSLTNFFKAVLGGPGSAADADPQ